MRGLKTPFSSLETKLWHPTASCVLWLPGQDDPQSATIRDRSGQGNHGTIVGATWARNAQGVWTLVYDGDDYVTFGNKFNFGNSLVDSAFSGIIWAKITSDTADGLISKWVGGEEWRFITVGTNDFRFQIEDTSVDNVQPKIQSPINAYTLGTWNCFGWTYDGTGGATAMNGANLYLNGTVVASPTRTNEATYVAMENLGGSARIGTFGAGTFLVGSAGIGLICTGVLTAQQIAGWYAQTRHLYGV